MKKSVLCLFSGGIDSTVVVKHYLDKGWDVTLFFVQYGQPTMEQEWKAIWEVTSQNLAISLLRAYPGLNPEIQQTVTSTPFYADGFFYPMRNAYLLCLAINRAYELKIKNVALGASSGDYLDIRPEFIDRFNFMQEYCLKKPIWVLAPFAHWSKEKVIKYGLKIEAPLHLTYSCMDYPPCGKCHDCKLREKYGIGIGQND